MITQLYYYLLVALFATTTIFGLLFLTQFNENKKTLHNFRIAKRLTALAFFFVAAGNLMELFEYTGNPAATSSNGDFVITQILTLSVSATQAFILTLVCILLLDPKNLNPKYLKGQIAAIASYVIIAVGGYLMLPKSAFPFFILLLSVMYCIVLVYFTVFFVLRYRSFRRVMDNFYSDNTAARMRWVAVAFYGSLAIGIFSLIAIQHVNFGLSFVFGISLLCFYTFFGIKLLNYPWQFEIIETPMAEESDGEQALSVPPVRPETANDKDMLMPNEDEAVSIEQWMEEKYFLKPGVTIDDLTAFLGTNRTYLSIYFNSEIGMTFRQWINFLRIEEAKLIISDNPKITMTELATRLGYADTSTFFRQFKAKEGIQPSIWKQSNVSKQPETL